MPGQTFQLHGQIQYFAHGRIFVIEFFQFRLHMQGILQSDFEHVWDQFGQFIRISIGHTQHSGHIPDHRPGSHGAESDDL